MTIADQPDQPAPSMLDTHYEDLQEQIGDVRRQSGKDYHDGAQVEDWLDYCLGPQNWSFKVLAHGRDEDSDEVWVSGRLTATFWLTADIGEPLPHVVVKENFGGQQLKRFKPQPDGEGGMILGKAISVADDRKGAATDCLKRCARLLGISRYLWRKPDSFDLPYRRNDEEEAARNRPQARPQGQQAAPSPRNASQGSPAPIRPQAPPQAAPVPLSPSERDALEHTYETLLDEALAGGFQGSWVGQGSAKWTDIQLAKYVGVLDAFLARTRNRGAA